MGPCGAFPVPPIPLRAFSDQGGRVCCPSALPLPPPPCPRSGGPGFRKGRSVSLPGRGASPRVRMVLADRARFFEVGSGDEMTRLVDHTSRGGIRGALAFLCYVFSGPGRRKAPARDSSTRRCGTVGSSAKDQAFQDVVQERIAKVGMGAQGPWGQACQGQPRSAASGTAGFVPHRVRLVCSHKPSLNVQPDVDSIPASQHAT